MTISAMARVIIGYQSIQYGVRIFNSTSIRMSGYGKGGQKAQLLLSARP